MISLERQIFEYFENVKNYIRIQPLNFAGLPGPSGGTGGPPGGIIGQLPQTSVTYDTTEAESSYTPPSGSLVDNLNHIRFRVASLEASGGGGSGTGTITVQKGGATVASGITTLNLTEELNVTSSGVVATVEHPLDNSDYYNITVNSTVFDTTKVYIAGSLKVYWNGLRQYYTDYVETSPASGVWTMGFTVPSGGKVIADYSYYASSPAPSGGGGVVGWGSSPWGSNPWGA